jgi:acetoin utilization protein AcuC
MACTLYVAWDERLTSYDFGPGHPLAPVRVELTMALAAEYGLLTAPGVMVAAPPAATEEQLRLIHDPDYIAAVRVGTADFGYGLGTPDNPTFPGMHDASALVAGATLAAAEAVWTGTANHAVNVAGGLHHAMRALASGFCIYNDPAIAIAWLLGQGAERVAYVDTDVHHGDGVQAAFYHDPRVLTISIHEHPMTLFPGTGLPSETGGPGAEGSSVNVALPAGTGDDGWLRAFDAVVPPLLRAFRPQVLVSQHGCDSHRLDPLAHLELSVDGQRAALAQVHRLAHETAGGRWLLTGGGGYELVQVVPRTWTHLLAEAAGQPLDPAAATPERWREYAARRAGTTPPLRMTDGEPASFTPFAAGYNPADPVDRASWRPGARSSPATACCRPRRSARPGPLGYRAARPGSP